MPTTRVSKTILTLGIAWILSAHLPAKDTAANDTAANDTAAKDTAAKDTAAPVPADLQELYARTHSAVTEADFTAIARACANVIPHADRSTADKAYASKLLAWALNRRGEIRGESAAKCVADGRLVDAQALDRLAGKDFATAAQYAPSNWRIHHNLAIALAMQGDYEQAIASFDQVISLKDDYPNAFYNRAELLFEQGQFARAVSDYSRALQLAPDEARYFNGRAHARFMLNSHEDAIADYRQATEFEPKNEAYLTDLADALQFTGKWSEAANLYRQAVATDRSYARAYRNIAWLLATCPDVQFRNPNLALAAARKASELSSDTDFRSLDTLAAATAATGDSKTASNLIREALQHAPADAMAELKQRAAIYSTGGQFVQTAIKPVKASSVGTPEVRTVSSTSP